MARLLQLNSTSGPKAAPISRVREIAKVPRGSPIYRDGVRTPVICGADHRYNVVDEYDDVCRAFEADEHGRGSAALYEETAETLDSG